MDRTQASYIIDLGGWDLDPAYGVETALSDAELDLLCDLALADVDKARHDRRPEGTDRRPR